MTMRSVCSRSLAHTLAFGSTTALLAALAACGGASPDLGQPGLEVLDSAGVEVIRDARAERILAVEEVLRVGVLDGDPDHQFFGIRTVAPDGEGGFWVVDRNPSIRRYDAEGRLSGQAGGEGRGPGEARSWGDVVAGEGWILAGSSSPPALQRFAFDGTYLGSRSANPDGGGFLLLQGAAGEQVILRRQHWSGVRENPSDMAGGGLVRGSMEVVTVPDTLEPLTSVASFPGSLRREGGAGGPYVLGAPSFAADGRGWIHASDTLAYRIEAFDLDGALRRVVERPQPPRELPDDFVQRMRDGMELTFRDGIPDIFGPGLTPGRREQIEVMTTAATPPTAPPNLPFIDRILATPEGALWVERADRHPRPAMRAVAHAFGLIRHAWHPAWRALQVFDIFKPDGRYHGTAEFPFDYYPMAVEGDRVFTLHADELGVERIVVFRVELER